MMFHLLSTLSDYLLETTFYQTILNPVPPSFADALALPAPSYNVLQYTLLTFYSYYLPCTCVDGT